MKRRPAFRSAPVALRWLALAALILLAPILSGAIPTWWVSRGVVASGTPAPGESDFAALNLGQLKTLAFAAYAELAAPGSAGASTGIEDLIKTWCQTDGAGNILIGANGRPTPKPATNETADFAAVNVGQLKTVAKPFYERLIAIGYVDDFPWVGTSDPTSDFAMANVGQAKTLFSFDVKPDSDSDGIPDWWERRHGLNPNSPPGGSDAQASTIFWGVPNSTAYALGYSRTRTGQARLAPRRPNVPPPPDAPPPPPPSVSPTGDLFTRTVLTAERRKSLTSETSETYDFPTTQAPPDPTTYAKKGVGLLRSTDPQGTPRYGINGDADLLGKLYEDSDPRDYGYDDDNDDGVDQDFNGDPDEIGDILPPVVWNEIDYIEWHLNQTNTANYRSEDHPNTVADETQEPVKSEQSKIRVWSSDRGNPGQQIEDSFYNPLGGGADSYLADSYVTYGTNAGMGWMGDGPNGRKTKTATATHTTSSSTLTWVDPNDEILTFQSNFEGISLEWVQIRVQSNIAPGPDETLESPFAIYDNTACVGVITLITDPGNFFATRFRASSDTLAAMVRTVGGAATINLEPPSQPLASAPPAVGTYTGTLMAVPAPTIFVNPSMHGVVGDEIPSILGANGEKHFVSPQKTTEVPGDYVFLDAFGVSEADFATYYRWDVGPVDSSSIIGAPVPGSPMSYRAPRSDAGICRVRIVTKNGGFLVAKFNVWVVWAEGMLSKAPTMAGPDTIRGTYRVTATSNIGFNFVISPPAICDLQSDVPDLTGVSDVPVPGADNLHLLDEPGGPSKKWSDGATTKWDVSRQIKVTRHNPDNIPLNHYLPNEIRDQPRYLMEPFGSRVVQNWPLDPVAGNDDSYPDGQGDEDCYPYAGRSGLLAHGVGELSSLDGPELVGPFVQKEPFAPADPPLEPGVRFGVTLECREFVRLQIGAKWFRISRHIPWSMWSAVKIKSLDRGLLKIREWQNDGSDISY